MKADWGFGLKGHSSRSARSTQPNNLPQNRNSLVCFFERSFRSGVSPENHTDVPASTDFACLRGHESNCNFNCCLKQSEQRRSVSHTGLWLNQICEFRVLAPPPPKGVHRVPSCLVLCACLRFHRKNTRHMPSVPLALRQNAKFQLFPLSLHRFRSTWYPPPPALPPPDAGCSASPHCAAQPREFTTIVDPI